MSREYQAVWVIWALQVSWVLLENMDLMVFQDCTENQDHQVTKVTGDHQDVQDAQVKTANVVTRA